MPLTFNNTVDSEKLTHIKLTKESGLEFEFLFPEQYGNHFVSSEVIFRYKGKEEQLSSYAYTNDKNFTSVFEIVDYFLDNMDTDELFVEVLQLTENK